MIGDFLDGHGGMAQQVHGDLQPQGQVIMVRGGPVFTLKYIVGPGAGEMGVGGNFVDMQGTVDILLDKAFHGKSRGSLLLMADQDFRKQLNIMMKKESQFAFAVDRVFFHDGEGFHKILLVLKIFHITVGAQMVIREQVLHKHAPDIEPYLGPGLMGVGIVVMVSAGMKNVGRARAQGHLPVIKVYIAPPADYIFEDIMVAVGTQNMVIWIRKCDAGGQRRKLCGVRSQIKIIFFPGCSVDIRHTAVSS